jgi:hypothetical protein
LGKLLAGRWGEGFAELLTEQSQFSGLIGGVGAAPAMLHNSSKFYTFLVFRSDAKKPNKANFPGF